MSDLLIRQLDPGDIQPIATAFAGIGWNKPARQYERYLAEQARGERLVLVAFLHGAFAGYLTVVWKSGYLPFRTAGIPEIVDFNVLPKVRRRGVGSRLMDEAERHIAERSAVVGIGVGMYPDYGAAQRLYVKRGYVPDGRGLSYKDHHVAPGETVIVDDGLVLHFTRDLSRPE
jgi:ribosomal protein S18 acetylase RimI-like enzyme